VVQAFRTAFPDLHFTIEDLFVAREKVVVRSTARGTHQGTFLGVPPTGQRVEFRAADIHRVAHGLIVDTWHLEDFFSFLVEVKAFPAH
jgi:predicted ester cyclase